MRGKLLDGLPAHTEETRRRNQKTTRPFLKKLSKYPAGMFGSSPGEEPPFLGLSEIRQDWGRVRQSSTKHAHIHSHLYTCLAHLPILMLAVIHTLTLTHLLLHPHSQHH